jgi:hypothetical protein
LFNHEDSSSKRSRSSDVGIDDFDGYDGYDVSSLKSSEADDFADYDTSFDIRQPRNTSVSKPKVQPLLARTKGPGVVSSPVAPLKTTASRKVNTSTSAYSRNAPTDYDDTQNQNPNSPAATRPASVVPSRPGDADEPPIIFDGTQLVPLCAVEASHRPVFKDYDYFKYVCWITAQYNDCSACYVHDCSVTTFFTALFRVAASTPSTRAMKTVSYLRLQAAVR